MTYYTDYIPLPLAEKLKEKGCPVEIVNDNTEEHSFPTEYHCETMVAEVFDWLMARGVNIRIESDWDVESQIITDVGRNFYIEKVGMRPTYVDIQDWHEAAEAAIEKALTLI